LSKIQTDSVHGWRWIFIVEGLMTIVAAIVAWFFIVDFPQKAKFLKEEERTHAIKRLNEDRGDGDHDQITWEKIKLHLSDWKVWGYSLMVATLLHPSDT
jgi:MFS family permease